MSLGTLLIYMLKLSNDFHRETVINVTISAIYAFQGVTEVIQNTLHLHRYILE